VAGALGEGSQQVGVDACTHVTFCKLVCVPVLSESGPLRHAGGFQQPVMCRLGT
jgi:hypothetical protein